MQVDTANIIGSSNMLITTYWLTLCQLCKKWTDSFFGYFYANNIQNSRNIKLAMFISSARNNFINYNVIKLLLLPKIT